MAKKKRCEICKRLLRTCKLKRNKLTGQILCKRCNNKIGTNKFYSPKSTENNFISKYSITDDEKNYLASQNGWERTNKTNRGLKTIKEIKKERKKKFELKKEKKKQEKEDLNKKFKEGLK
jgi:hypothetical protein